MRINITNIKEKKLFLEISGDVWVQSSDSLKYWLFVYIWCYKFYIYIYIWVK